MPHVQGPCSLSEGFYMALAVAVETEPQMHLELVTEQPAVLLVTELEGRELVQHRAQRFIESVGRTALRAEVNYDKESIPSLMDAIHHAAGGNSSARKMVDANVSSDAVERTYKAGHVIETRLTIGKDAITQHGQSSEDIQANSLLYASEDKRMLARSKVETLNKFWTDYCLQAGLLDSHYLVVPSLCDDTMTDDELTDNGFFAETKSGSFQATTKEGNELIVESAFVAGVKQPGQGRHDIETLVSLAAQLGVDYSGLSTTDIIGTPMLISKDLLKNGVIDFVRLYDQAAGGTFFGEDKPPQDYIAYLEVCRQRERDLAQTVQAIVRQLISEADRIRTPVQAIKRLHKLSQQFMVDRAIIDKTINPRVFGPEAAGHIEQARAYQAQGDYAQAELARRQAQQTAKSSSCPGAYKDEEDKRLRGETDETDSSQKSEVHDSKEKIRCINCNRLVDKKKVVKVDCWECPKCLHKVDICNGAVLRQGNTEAPKKVKMRMSDFITFGQVEKQAA